MRNTRRPFLGSVFGFLKGHTVFVPRFAIHRGSAALFLQPELVVFGPDSQHLRATLRAAFLLAGHTALVRHARFALGADTLSALPHRVLAFALGHFADLLSDFRGS